MNLSRLRFAKAIAELHSFSRAAEACHVTQPTLSNGIALLEEDFGERLFRRTTRKVELTPFGAQVLPLIEAVLEAEAELRAGVKAYFEPALKIVRIGFSPLVDSRRLGQVLEPYKAAHPEVQIFLKECFLGDLEERLERQQIDLALRPVLPDDEGPGGAGNGGATGKDLAHCPFYREPLSYLPRQSEAEIDETGGSVALRALDGETLVLSHNGCGLAFATRKLFKDAGLTLHEYSGQALSYQVMQDWADLGIGGTILPRSKIASEYRGRARSLLLDAERQAEAQFDALWMKSAAYPDHVAALHAHFRKTVPKLLEGAAG